jgi:RNA polymerase sigma factor (sigma-70 family)
MTTATTTTSLWSVLEESGITPTNPMPPMPFNGSTNNLKSRARKLKAQKIRVVYSDCFDDQDAAETIIGPLPGKELDKVKPMEVLPMPDVQPPVGLDNYLSQLYSCRTLADNQERYLARKANYLKYRVLNLRDGLSVNLPTRELVNKIESLLSEAAGCRNQLAQSKLRLVTWFAKRAYFHDEERSIDNLEDYIQIGNIALVRAADYFNYEKHRAFIAYAAAVIRNEISQHRITRRIIPTSNAVEHETIDQREDPHERDMHVRDGREYLNKLLFRLNERGQRLVRLYYGFGFGEPLTFREMSEQEGVTQTTLSRKCNHPMGQLKETAVTREAPAEKPWKPVGTERPEQFTAGPLIGSLKRIAAAVFGGSPDLAYPKLEASCRRFKKWITETSKRSRGVRGANQANLFAAWFHKESEFTTARAKFVS